MNALAGLNDPNIGAGVLNSFAEGQRMGEQQRMRRALADYAADPQDGNALRVISGIDPGLGMKLSDRAAEQAFRRDAAAFLAPNGQPNALLGLPPTPAVEGPRGGGMTSAPTNALAGPSSSGNAAAMMGGGIVATPEQEAESERLTRLYGMEGVTVQDGPSADLSMLGEPSSNADQAFLRMVQRDPIKALKIRSELRDNYLGHLEQGQQFYGLAMQELATVNDEAGWQQALARLAPLARALGGDLSSMVPSNYPGPEGVQALMRRAMPVKDQLDYLLREANIEADNARSDRNTDSMIATREARAAEYARNNRERSANQRRGQDMTDRRSRSGGSRGPRVVSVKTPAEARALKPGTRYRGPDGVVRER